MCPNILIDGVPAIQIVRHAIEHGWIQYPARRRKRTPEEIAEAKARKREKQKECMKRLRDRRRAEKLKLPSGGKPV